MVKLRETVFQALNSTQYIATYLQEVSLDGRDRRFAEELAYGMIRRKLTLEYYLKQLVDKGKSLKLKRSQRLVLHMALYQALFMDRVPVHAWTNESIELAKKHLPKAVIPFLTYLLHKIPKHSFTLPNGNSAHALSIRYSYPEVFVKQLIEEQGEEKTHKILELGNQPPALMARVLKESETSERDEYPPFRLIKIDDLSCAHTSDYYIQNSTPLHLLSTLAQGSLQPQSILDLCASPGGKTLAVHTLFPKATLTANDVSENKIKRLSENMQKYQITARITQFRGEEYPLEPRYDLIIADLPCSNSGVFHKRVEARWRYSSDHLEKLFHLQLNILLRALQCLNPNGELWVLTCSLLKSENERLIHTLCDKHGCKVRKTHLQLLTTKGDEGGYGCALQL